MFEEGCKMQKGSVLDPLHFFKCHVLQIHSEGLFLQGKHTLHFAHKPAKMFLSATEVPVFLPTSGDRQLPASGVLQVVGWLLLALQQSALWINKQMQLRLKQANIST